jgi:hypothetical protein
MNTPHFDIRLTRSSLVAIAIGAILAAGGCKTNSAGGGAPSVPSPTSSPSGGSPMPSTGGSPVPSMPSPAPGTGAPSMPSTGTAAPSMPSTSTGGSTAALPSSEPGAGKPSSGSAVPQSGSANGAGSSGTADNGRAQTPDERRGAIDKRLDDSLGTFDKEIRKEQEKNAQERDARNAANAGSAQEESDDTEKDGDIASGGTASTEGPDKDDRQSRPGDLKSDKDRKKSEGAGSNGPQGNSGGDAKTEIPDGSDDDVVARRLRKAAEAETDPELKEKLWKEYIEYKKNAK